MTAFRQFKLPWIAKSIAFNIFSYSPFGESVYYGFQRHVTKTIPRLLTQTDVVAATQLQQAAEFGRAGGNIKSAKIFEFGAGWDLYSNLLLWCLGAERQTTIDIRRWAKADAINAVIEHLKLDPPNGAVRVPEHQVAQRSLERDLLQHYGISYRAPADARNVNIEDNFFDFILTTSVLEHVPTGILNSIAIECHRILKPGGYMRHVIDFSDHYAHSDGSISEFNYLRFGSSAWKLHNPSIHFQNRLRRTDYERLFLDAGFVIERSEPWLGSKADLASITIHPEFERYSEQDLLEIGCALALRKI